MVVFIDKFKRFCGSEALGGLILLNAAIFLLLWIILMAGNMSGITGNFTTQWLCVPANPSLFLLHFWTAVSYMFTHYDFLHLLFNMLWLLWFGRMLLTAFSDRHLLWLYVGGGLTGAILYVGTITLWPSLSPGGTYLCGASASVLAIMAASAVRTPDLRIRLLLLGDVKLKWLAIGCIILTFAGVGGGNSGGQAAHIGGVAFGLIFSLAANKGHDLSLRLKPKSRKPETDATGFNPPPRKNVVRDGNAVARAASGRLSDTARLDELLDKIRISGYGSLTAGERNELNALSQRLDKERH